MFCPQCGAPNEDDAIFCGNCGAVLNADEVSAGEPVAGPGEEFPAESEETILAELPAPPPPPSASPPPRAYAAPPSLPTSGMAIASLVLGVGGLTVVPLVGSILAIIFGYAARNDIRQRPDEVSGEGLAMAGIIMGWIAVGLTVLGILAGAGFLVCGICGSMGAGSY